jgi:formate dehydrogenase subunit delta
MHIDNLVVMANRIGDFFQSMPDRKEAKQGIANHLRKFWEPRMRSELISQMDDPSTENLYPIVREAVVENESTLLPQNQASADPSGKA